MPEHMDNSRSLATAFGISWFTPPDGQVWTVGVPGKKTTLFMRVIPGDAAAPDNAPQPIPTPDHDVFANSTLSTSALIGKLFDFGSLTCEGIVHIPVKTSPLFFYQTEGVVASPQASAPVSIDKDQAMNNLYMLASRFGINCMELIGAATGWIGFPGAQKTTIYLRKEKQIDGPLTDSDLQVFSNVNAMGNGTGLLLSLKEFEIPIAPASGQVYVQAPSAPTGNRNYIFWKTDDAPTAPCVCNCCCCLDSVIPIIPPNPIHILGGWVAGGGGSGLLGSGHTVIDPGNNPYRQVLTSIGIAQAAKGLAGKESSEIQSAALRSARSVLDSAIHALDDAGAG
jgi:hypothetical protein